MINNRILVTGSNGFIGNSLLEALSSEKKYIIKGIDQPNFSNQDWIIDLEEILNSFVPEVIFHVGACANTLESDIQYMFETNYQSTKLLADWAKANRAKFINSSSAANYGTNGEYPSNLYGWSKYAAEGYAKLIGGVNLRYFNVYGPGESKKGKMASIFFQGYIKNRESLQIELFPGSPRRDFVYIKDVISANFYALKFYEAFSGNIFEVGSGKASAFEEGLNHMGVSFKYSEVEKIPKGYQFLTESKPSKWMPGWAPLYSLEKGCREYKSRLDSQFHLKRSQK